MRVYECYRPFEMGGPSEEVIATPKPLGDWTGKI